MSQIITLKIDVTKFDKSAFYKGDKGTYATISVFVNDEKDQYGNFGMVKQDLGKERREAGERGPILGNVLRINGGNGGGSGAASQMHPPMTQTTPVNRGATNNWREDQSDSIPF
jgi:hypothetical protein